MLGIVNRICGTVGYFTFFTQIPQNRKVGRNVHNQDIVLEKWSGFQQSNILHETAKRMHRQVSTLRCFHINKNGGI